MLLGSLSLYTSFAHLPVEPTDVKTNLVWTWPPSTMCFLKIQILLFFLLNIVAKFSPSILQTLASRPTSSRRSAWHVSRAPSSQFQQQDRLYMDCHASVKRLAHATLETKSQISGLAEHCHRPPVCVPLSPCTVFLMPPSGSTLDKRTIGGFL